MQSRHEFAGIYKERQRHLVIAWNIHEFNWGMYSMLRESPNFNFNLHEGESSERCSIISQVAHGKMRTAVARRRGHGTVRFQLGFDVGQLGVEAANGF